MLIMCLSLAHAYPMGGFNDLVADIQYQNEYDQPLNVYCHPRDGVYQVESVYSHGARDRRWTWHCRNLKKSGSTRCAETDYVNAFDEPLYFMCGKDQYIGGVWSYHDNGREDRRWKIRCCSLSGLKILSCQLTGYVNSFRQPLNYRVGYKEVITGVYSYHDNGQE